MAVIKLYNVIDNFLEISQNNAHMTYSTSSLNLTLTTTVKNNSVSYLIKIDLQGAGILMWKAIKILPQNNLPYLTSFSIKVPFV